MYKRRYDMSRPWKDVMEELAEDDVHEEFYNSNNPLVQYFHRKRIAIIRDLVGRQQIQRVLEVGSGDGFVLEAISDLNVSLTGVEISEKRIERSKKRAPEASIMWGDARQLDCQDDAFDLTICTEVLEHIPKPELAVNEIIRVTRDGGLVIISVPHETMWRMGRAALLRFPIRIPDHVNQFNVRKMNRLFKTKPLKMHYCPPLGKWFCLTYIFVYQLHKASMH